MKAKKIVALVMSAAMVIGAASMFAACKNNPEGEKPGPGPKPAYVEDTNSYYAVGEGKGDDTTHGTLYKQGVEVAGGTENGWNPKSDDIPFTKNNTIEDENVYELELTMYAGDAFKILYDKDAGWGGEAINFFSLEADYIDGDGSEATYTVEGETWFVTNGDSNIICNEDQDGVYKFTLKTYPEAETKYVISVEKTDSIERLKIPYKMRVLGDFNNYGIYTGGEMTFDSTTKVWSIIIEVTAEDLTCDETGAAAATGATHSALYVANVGDGEGVENEQMEFVQGEGVTVGETTVNLVTEGKWTVTFNQETKAVTVTELTDDWNVVVGSDEYKLNDTTMIAEFTLTEAATGVKLVNKYDNTEKTIGDLAAGTYVVKYDSEKDTVECEAYAYWIVGTFVDSESNNKNFEIVDGLTPVMTKTENENEYTATLVVVDISENEGYAWASGVFQIQVVYGTKLTGVKTWNVNGGNYGITGGAGTYTVTIDVTNGEETLSVTPYTE